MMGELKKIYDAAELTPENEEIQKLQADLKSTRWSLFFSALVIILLIACIFQQKTLTEQTEKEAYLLSIVVSEYEDLLLFKYETTPNILGLGEYRDAWINNPCHETIFPYYTKLSEVVEMLEQGILPNAPSNDIFIGDLLPV